ncbi:MAG: DNA-binding domain-containing protein [Dokdonella sp.]
MHIAPPLHDLQRGFVEALMGRSSDVASWVEACGLDPDARVRIYRNAVASTQTAALRETYPTVFALVGEGFFDTLAAGYRQQHPSSCGHLQRFGDALADFIADMPETQSLSYLPDIARLDWLCNLTALALAADAVAASACAAAATVEPSFLKLRLHASIGLLRSAHEVLAIWQWCQTPSESNLQLDSAGEHVLIWRDAGMVAMTVIAPATYCFIQSLVAGCDLASASTAALDVDPDFQFGPCLRDLLAHGLVVAFIYSERLK